MRMKFPRVLAGSLLAAMAFLAGPSASLARPAKHKAAAKHDSLASSGASSPGASRESAPYEPVSPAANPQPSLPPPILAVDTTSGGMEKAPAPLATSDATPAADTKESSQTTDSSMPAPGEEPPVVGEPQPAYVDHLGPSSYPGKLRGIYGGSLWLEPSFHGLQWPTMAKSGVGVSGSLWVDSGYEKITREPNLSPNTTMWLQQARAVLRVTPTYVNGNFFIQGQVELVGNQCQTSSPICTTAGTFDTDDLWLRFGQWNLWDVKVGRFEGWEIYHTGMGLDINTLERQGAKRDAVNTPDNDLDAPDYYGVNYLHDRPSAGLGIGYVALHAYPAKVFRFELLGELGTDSVNTTSGKNYLGGRPTAILDLGWLKLKVGAEYERRSAGTQTIDNGNKQDAPYRGTRKGFGGSVIFVIDPVVEFGVSAGRGSQLETDLGTGIVRPTATFTTNSVGGFLNARVAPLWIVGGGVNFTWQNDSFYYNGSSDPDYTAHLQALAAVQYLMARQLFIKAVFGYARADFMPSDQSIDLWSNYMYSARIRLMYLY